MLPYLSPTSLSVFESEPEQFYLNYCRPGAYDLREPQTMPMAVGSAFDAKIKPYLGEAIGFPQPDLFDKQVEEHNREEAHFCGRDVFNAYVKSGAADRLIARLKESPVQPRFETDVRGTIDGVPLRGKPDIVFFTTEASRVILDFKVNGYFAKKTTSPKPGYALLRPENKTHKNYTPGNYRGFPCDAKAKIAEIDAGWADQMAIYSWLTGERVGSEDVIVAIEQIVGPSTNLRIASFRNRMDSAHQLQLVKRLKYCWEVINSDWFFRDVSQKESQLRCRVLNEQTAWECF